MSQPILQDVAERDQASANPAAAWALAAGIVVLGAIFFREGRAAVEVWIASTAYSHCFLILPMTLYLLWERRAELSQCSVRPAPVWACLALPVTLAWFIAERLGIMEGRQLAAVAGLQVLFLAVLGPDLYRRCAGPLLFLFFLVPFGAFLTSALQRFTAAFSIAGLDLLSIPNFSDGFIIETQAGIFFVAEACAGLRFLIASFAFGVFYALLTYTSYTRRLAFIGLSIVVPIVANGFRALGIVVLGETLGSAQAAAADHVVYGWVFFSLVMLLLIGFGQLFREPARAPRRPGPSWCSPVSGSGALKVAIVIVAVLGVGPAVASAIDTNSKAPRLGSDSLVALPVGCIKASDSAVEELSGRAAHVDCAGTKFTVTVTAFAPRSTSSAMTAERRRATQEIGAENVTVVAAEVPSGAGDWTIVQTSDPNRVTAYASWVNGVPSEQGLAGRVSQARNSLFGSDHAPLLITISAAESANATPPQRAATLNRIKSVLAAQSDLNTRVGQSTDLRAVSSHD